MDYVTHVVAIGGVTLLANSFLKIYCEADTGLTMCAGGGGRTRRELSLQRIFSSTLGHPRFPSRPYAIDGLQRFVA